MNFDLVSIKKNDLVGLDITTDTLLMAYLSKRFKKKELVDIYSCDIQGFSDDDIAKHIKSFLDNNKIKNPVILSVIPSRFTITKNIEIPSMDPKEIKEIISLHANRQTPYNRDEIVVDYINIGVSHNNYTKILQVIVTKNFVKKHINILERLNLEPRVMVLAPDAISSFYSNLGVVKARITPRIILQIDSFFTDFLVIYNENIIFLRSMPIGKKQLLEEKERFEGLFLEEFKKTIDSYNNEGIENIPSELIITEKIPGLESLEELLRKVFEGSIKTIPYLSGITISSKVNSLLKVSNIPSFLNVIAPLLFCDKLKVDFTPEEIKIRRAIKERGKDIIGFGILIIIFLILVCSVFLNKMYFEVTHLKRLEKQYEKVNKEAQDIEKSFDRVRMVRKYLSKRGYPLEVLKELYSITPADIRYSDINFDVNGEFSITGTAESMSKIFSFVTELERSKLFKNVKTKYTNTKEENNRIVADFKITFNEED